MATRPTLAVALLLCLIGWPGPAAAWGLKTHAWIAQTVLNDVLDDGQVVLAGRSYAVPAHVLAALRAHPERYRMGNLGPDVFPDPVVGQTTTHPGVTGGWQTDDWLEHVLQRAQTSEEIAFAYGFAGHAAADIFAHSYVNAYAGDVFSLVDREVEVERRHFVLEKNIDALLPPVAGLGGNESFVTATSFLRDVLIMDPAVLGQYRKTPSAIHLAAMQDVRNAVRWLDQETQKVIGRLAEFIADDLRFQANLQAELISGRLQIEFLEAALRGEETLLDARRQAHAFAIARLNEANEIVQKHPALINHQERLLIEQAKIAADLLAKAADLAAHAEEVRGRLHGEVDRLRGQIAELACYLLTWPRAIKKCRNKVREINRTISRLESQITLANERRDAARRAANEAAALRDSIKAELDRLREELDKATRDLATGALEGAVAAAELDLRAQGEKVRVKRQALDEARRIQQEIAAKLREVTAFIELVQDAIERYNPVTLLLRNWLNDIGIAAEEYIKASHRAGLAMLTNEGSPLDEYKTWLDCYGGVFTGTPRQVEQAGCLGKKWLEDLDRQIDSAIAGLPEILRWVIAPSRELQRLAKRELEPELRKAETELVKFVTSDTVGDFLYLLAGPENATRSKLIEVFRTDGTGKNLIRFNDVSVLLDRDLGPEGNVDPAGFAALSHAVTLTKLTLLGPGELNSMVRDLAGDYTSVYGPGPYPPRAGNFTLLFEAVRSIDGNHQWQAYGLPYPRALGTAHAGSRGSHYGHDFFENPAHGLRIWVDPYLRERVFLTLFPAPVEGSLSERAELQWPHYRFPACAENPFPSTQDGNGTVRNEDPLCTILHERSAPRAALHFANASEYQSRYLQCSDALAGSRHWTVVGSFGSRKPAEQMRDEIVARFPDMTMEVWRPRAPNRHWTIMAAACTSAERAAEAQLLAKRRGIAMDAFVWRAREPWEPALEPEMLISSGGVAISARGNPDP